MRFISRECKVYEYTFVQIDLATGQTTNVQKIAYPERLPKKEIERLSSELGIMLAETMNSEKLCMPLAVFIDTARAWMAQNDQRPSNMKDSGQETDETEPENLTATEPDQPTE